MTGKSKVEISQNFVAFSGYMKFRDSECFRIGLGVYKLLEKYCVKVMLTAIVVACFVPFLFLWDGARDIHIECSKQFK